MSENQHVCPRKFKFFRVLLAGFSNKLSIPHKFMNYFIKENSTWATILSPLGKPWNVKIGGDNIGLYFEEGWKSFAEAHKLCLGDFLVFKYRGGLVFDVTIFDKSTCERDYNVINGIASDSVPVQEENCEKEHECSREQTPPSCGRRTAPVMEQAEARQHQPEELREKEQQERLHGAKESTKMCKRASRFVVIIRPIHKYHVIIPITIVRSNDLSSICQLLLRDPKGHLWPTELVHRSYASQTRSQLVAGWRDFHAANSLEAGDVCVFELKKKDEMLVQIHRRGPDSMKIWEDYRRSKKPLHGKAAVKLKQPTTLPAKGVSIRGHVRTTTPVQVHHCAF